MTKRISNEHLYSLYYTAVYSRAPVTFMRTVEDSRLADHNDILAPVLANSLPDSGPRLKILQ